MPKENWFNCKECKEIIKSKGLKSAQALQTWFTNRVIEYLKTKGREAILWNDSITDVSIEAGAVCQYWNAFEDIGSFKQRLKNNRRVIDSNYRKYYLDYPYSIIPLEETYCYESIFEEDADELKLLGVECPVWTEFISDNSTLYAQMFPRFMAVAETGWTKNSKKDYYNFLERLAFQRDLLKAKGINLPGQSSYKVCGFKGALMKIEHYSKLVKWDTLKIMRKIRLERNIGFDEEGNIYRKR